MQETTSTPPAPEIRAPRVLDRYAILNTEEEETFDRLARLASHTTQMPIALVSLQDGDRQWFKAHIGLEARETPIEHSFCIHAVQQQDVFVVSDARADPRFAANPLVTGEPGIRFYAGAPLRMTDGSSIGTLCVIDSVPRTLHERERSILRDLAAIAAREIELTHAAITDPLTGAFNRRTMMMMVEKEIARFDRTQNPFTLAAFDLDHFKRVNDTYGHEAGDRVLSRFVKLAGEHLRQQDLLFRIGGEEFVMVLPETNEVAAEIALDRFRKQLEQTPIQTNAGPIYVTVSIGIAEATPQDTTVKTIGGRADEALYNAKHQGRNRIARFFDKTAQ